MRWWWCGGGLCPGVGNHRKMKKKTAAAKGVERGAAPALASAQRSEHFTKGLEDAKPTTQ